MEGSVHVKSHLLKRSHKMKLTFFFFLEQLSNFHYPWTIYTDNALNSYNDYASPTLFSVSLLIWLFNALNIGGFPMYDNTELLPLCGVTVIPLPGRYTRHCIGDWALILFFFVMFFQLETFFTLPPQERKFVPREQKKLQALLDVNTPFVLYTASLVFICISNRLGLSSTYPHH